MSSTENSVVAQPSVADVERAIELAARAPSIHHTQPWRFVLTADTLELWADDRRQLNTADLDGRALLVACGSALHLVSLGLAAVGWRTMTERLPDPARPDLLARIRFIGRRTPNERIRDMADAAGRRHTERRPFGPGLVPAELLSTVCAAVADTGVYVNSVRRPDERLNLAAAVSWADGLEAGDSAPPADPARPARPEGGAGDGVPPVVAGAGVPATAVPPVAPDRAPEVPVGDGPGGPDGPEPAAAVDPQPAYLVIFSREDDPTARVRAGETFARLSVKLQQLGLVSSAITQALDVPGVRDRLLVLMSWPDHPQMILRVGWPPDGDQEPTAPPPIATVLTVSRPDNPS